LKKAGRFNDILDECLERLLTSNQTMDECLASYPEQANELEPLLRTVLEAKRVLSFEPHPEVKRRARHEFCAALRQMRADRQSHPRK
jgi:hypothetical protein